MSNTASASRYINILLTVIFCFFFNWNFNPETDWNFAKTFQLHVQASNCSCSMLNLNLQGNYQFPGDLITSLKTIDWQFCHLSRFLSKWYFTSLRHSRDQGRLTFFTPHHQTPAGRIALLLNLLFAARVFALKCEPACRLHFNFML